jgi:two-component system OmpR family response regulator
VSHALSLAGVTPPAELAASDSTGPPPPPGRPRILIADDEVDFRELIAEYLAGKDLDVREAGSGEEAVKRVAEFNPHIVLLDIMMSGIGGLEALREIKAIAPRTAVIMVTAVDDLDAARGALARGAADYVTKPFPFRYLDAVLDVHMPHAVAISAEARTSRS